MIMAIFFALLKKTFLCVLAMFVCLYMVLFKPGLDVSINLRHLVLPHLTDCAGVHN
jgi:hypothetical protein